MKIIVLLFLPVLLFGQNLNYPDTIETKTGKVYPCLINELNESSVKIIYGDSISSDFDVSDLKNIVLQEKGEIYNTKDGFIYNLTFLKKFLAERSHQIKVQSPESIEHIYRPGDHELLLMPTAFTMNKGSAYFSDYELFLLNFTYAASSRTHIGFFTLFPVSSQFLETTTFGIKQNYLRDEVESAIWLTYTPKGKLLNLGNVISVRSNQNNFNFGLGGLKVLDDEKSEFEFVIMLGGKFDVSQKTSLILEYTNFSTFIENEINGLISVGFRFRGESIAWEIGGIRPLESTGDFLFFPLLKATFKFGD